MNQAMRGRKTSRSKFPEAISGCKQCLLEKSLSADFFRKRSGFHSRLHKEDIQPWLTASSYRPDRFISRDEGIWN